MNIIITGGAGFLGYHLCKNCSNKYERVYVIDTDPIRPGEYPPNVTYLPIDVRDKTQIRKAFRDAAVIVHAAAALPLWKPKDIFDININGTRNVLEAANELGIERVIFVSSTAVYGIPKKHPSYEDDPLIGVGPYGESKIEAEKMCNAFREKGLCVPIVRPKTFIGTGRLGVFQILFDWIEDGKKIPMVGSGSNRYQLLAVEDFVDCVLLLLTAPKEKVNDIFNVGAEKFQTLREDIETLCRYAKSGSRVISTPAWLVLPLLALFEKLKISPLYRWVYGTACEDSFVSIDKIKNQLGWIPKISNADSLINSYKWYLEHKREYTGTGITHHVAWKQGILKLFKAFL